LKRPNRVWSVDFKGQLQTGDGHLLCLDAE
jgi:hypothetical protein